MPNHNLSNPKWKFAVRSYRNGIFVKQTVHENKHGMQRAVGEAYAGDLFVEVLNLDLYRMGLPCVTEVKAA